MQLEHAYGDIELESVGNKRVRICISIGEKTDDWNGLILSESELSSLAYMVGALQAHIENEEQDEH